jgi:hypothetical protein
VREDTRERLVGEDLKVSAARRLARLLADTPKKNLRKLKKRLDKGQEM